MIETVVDKEPDATPAVVDRRVVADLVARASAEGVSLTGEGGLLQQLTKLVLESSLEGELDAHLGYGKHERAGRDGGNSRNGRRSKTVLTEVGPVEIDVPRDGDATGGGGNITTIGTGWNGYTSFGMTDLSGDGKPDLLVRDTSGNLWMYPGTGSGFGTRVPYGTGW